MGFLITVRDEYADVKDLGFISSQCKFQANESFIPNALHGLGEIAMPLMLIDNEIAHTLGTATMIGPGLIITANHNFDGTNSATISVCAAFIESDIARSWVISDISSISFRHKYDPQKKVKSDFSMAACNAHGLTHSRIPIKLPVIEFKCPEIGERVWCAGYRKNALNISTELNKEHITPYVCTGIVTERYLEGRDQAMLPNSCFEVAMTVVGGMSGGPVFNENGFLIGIISSSIDCGESTFVTLFPDLFRFDKIKKLPNVYWPSGIIDFKHAYSKRLISFANFPEEQFDKKECLVIYT